MADPIEERVRMKKLASPELKKRGGRPSPPSRAVLGSIRKEHTTENRNVRWPVEKKIS